MLRVNAIQASVFLIAVILLGACGGSNSTKDVNPPVITLIGVNPHNIGLDKSEIPQPYQDPGATAKDDVDGDVLVEVSGSVDTGVIGSYTLTYSSEDAAGNSASIDRIVNVIEKVVSDSDLIFGKDTTPLSSSWTKPELNKPYKDPAYGTTLRRMTSSDGTRFNRNKYSRIQSENSDGSYFFTYHGSARYHVYRTDTVALIRDLDIHPDAELQWHPSNPNIIRHLNGAHSENDSLKLYETNVLTGEKTVLVDLTEKVRAIFPSATEIYDGDEGSPNKDGNRYAWMVDDIDGRLLGFISYDLDSDKILGSLKNIPENIGEVDWISMTPSGQSIIASTADKYNRPIVTNDGTFAFKADFSDADFSAVNLIFASAEHSDIGIAKDGNDMYIYINFDSDSANAGWIMGYNLETQKYSRLVDIWADGANTSMHISAKNFNKPGWALISTYGGIEGAWTYRKIYALELVDNGRIANLAHTYNCADTYFQETQAVVNRDFSRVYFNSTSDVNKSSEGCGYDEENFYTEVYQIEVPALETEAALTKCTNPRPEVCTEEYTPVCAKRDTGIQCVTTPCPTIEYITKSNACMACSDDKVEGYIVGECP